MSILNRPSDGLVSVLIALRRAVIAYGPLDEDKLLQLCAPDAGPIKDSGMGRKTLTRWKQLGVFEPTANARITLSADVKGIVADDLATLRATLLRLVLAEQNNPGLAAERSDDEEARTEQTRSTDFSLAAAWALAQDPYTFATSHPQAEALRTSQGLENRLFSNNTRWNGFVEWAMFLGIGTSVGGNLVLNPWFALASVLEEVFRGRSELTYEQLLTDLADALPILDGGRYRQVITAQVAQPWKTFRDNEASPCLSLGLRTLQEKKILHLDSRSDAPECTLLGRGGRTLSTFSHAVRVSL